MPATQLTPLENISLVVGQERIATSCDAAFDRSDQKTRIHVLLLSLGGVRLKQAAKHLLTMSKDPATDTRHTGWSPNLLSDLRRLGISRGTGGAGRDRTDDILLAKQTLSQLSYGPVPFLERMVGPGRLELPTSRLSGVRSNHLSYGPSGSRQKTSFSAGER